MKERSFEMAILGILFIIIIFCAIILGLIFDLCDDSSSEKLAEKEKELSKLRYDDLAKEGRYLKFKEKYEFRERLAKELKIGREGEEGNGRFFK